MYCPEQCRPNKALQLTYSRCFAARIFPRSLRSLGARERRRYMRKEFIRGGPISVSAVSLFGFSASAASGEEHPDLGACAYNKALHVTPWLRFATPGFPPSLRSVGARERRRCASGNE